MEKQRYYVSVQANSIMSEPTLSAYEFAIDATRENCEQLRRWMDKKAKEDDDTFFRTPIPGIPYHQDEDNDRYDESLAHIYLLIHEWGTPETKRHIEQIGLVPAK